MGSSQSSYSLASSTITDNSKTEMNRTITDKSITDISTTNTSIDNSVTNIITNTNIDNSISISRRMIIKIKKAIRTTIIQTDEGDLSVTQQIKSKGPKVKTDKEKETKLKSLTDLVKKSDVSGKNAVKKKTSAQASAPEAKTG